MWKELAEIVLICLLPALIFASDIILLLIQAGADVNAQDSMGIAPLHWAASRELFQMTQVPITCIGVLK